MKTVITKEVQWDMGHRVPFHKSKCRHPHGHRYRLEMGISGRIVAEMGNPEMGMIVDYGHMKQMLMGVVHDPLDHGFMVWEGDTVMMPLVKSTRVNHGWNWIVVPFQPTAEEISRWLFLQLNERVSAIYGEDVWLTHVSLWETPSSVATTSGSAPERT